MLYPHFCWFNHHLWMIFPAKNRFWQLVRLDFPPFSAMVPHHPHPPPLWGGTPPLAASPAPSSYWCASHLGGQGPRTCCPDVACPRIAMACHGMRMDLGHDVVQISVAHWPSHPIVGWENPYIIICVLVFIPWGFFQVHPLAKPLFFCLFNRS